MNHPVFLYDGHCGFCQRGVGFVLRHEWRPTLRFAAQQGGAGLRMLAAAGFDGPQETLVLAMPDGRVFTKSGAVVRLAMAMGGPWRLAGAALWLVPAPLRDWGYDIVARNRKRFFGTVDDACMVPNPAARARFLES